MDQTKFKASIQKTFADGFAVVVKKNEDYANSADPFRNFRSAAVVGLTIPQAILVRTLDKISRVSNLLIKEQASVPDEKLEDSLLDAINYLAILKAYLESEHG